MKVQTFIIQLRKFISLSPPPLFRLLLKEKKEIRVMKKMVMKIKKEKRTTFT